MVALYGVKYTEFAAVRKRDVVDKRDLSGYGMGYGVCVCVLIDKYSYDALHFGRGDNFIMYAMNRSLAVGCK